MVPTATKSPPPLPGASPLRPRRLALAALLLGAGAATGLYFNNPAAASSPFIPCLWHIATDTHCPGCGITRALHALLHGHVFVALDYNAVGVLILLITAAMLARPAWIALRDDRWTPPVLPRRTAVWLTVVGLLWALLRNLPWPPFTALAP